MAAGLTASTQLGLGMAGWNVEGRAAEAALSLGTGGPRAWRPSAESTPPSDASSSLSPVDTERLGAKGKLQSVQVILFRLDMCNYITNVCWIFCIEYCRSDQAIQA